MNSESLFTKCKFCGKSIQKTFKKCPSCGKSLIHITLMHWSGTALISLIVYYYFNTPTPQARTEKESIAIRKMLAIDNIKLEYQWKKEGFGNIMAGDFTITNKNEFSFKDLEIKCINYSKSGTELDSNTRIIYDIFEAKTSKRHTNFNMGFIHEQTSESICHIRNLSLIHL